LIVNRRPVMVSLIFRKRRPAVFSIENLFDALYALFERSGEGVRRLELPDTSTGIVSVLKNAWFVARWGRGVLHVTGDVHYAALLRPLSKTIITVHDCVVLRRRTGLAGLALRMLWFELPLRTATIVTAISEETKREILKHFAIPETKIKVIPNFVDPTFTFDEKPFATACPRILHVGTTPNKNLSRVTTALRGIPCVLVIVGPLTPAMLAELRDNGIRYENFVGLDHAAMTRVYREADIISFPSTYEGFGMPILEGQAVGRAVLTSNLEPMRSVAGCQGALLVEPESVASIREGFLALLEDRALRARLIAGGADNCRRYSQEAVAAAYLDLYRSIG
jgi:glycosyltransferase involved in cell wall biosynthesis